MKNFKQYNESLRDQMTPKSEQDMIDNMGEENYKKYISLINAKDSIKNKGLVDDIIVDKKRDIVYFDMQIMSGIYTVSIDENKWNLNLRIGYNDVDEKYDTWEEVRERIKEDVKGKIIDEIDEKQDEINELQSIIDEAKKRISDIDENI